MSTKFSDDRVSEMLRGRRLVRMVPLPGFGEDGDPVMVGVRILLDTEVDDARGEAVTFINFRAKKLGLSPVALLSVDAEILDREIERQLVFRAFVQGPPEPGKQPEKFFPSPEAVRQLDTVMQKTLFFIYLDHQNRLNPLNGMTPGEVDELVEALGKGQEAVSLGLYDAPSLRSLVRTLAARLSSLLTSRSSDGAADAASTST